MCLYLLFWCCDVYLQVLLLFQQLNQFVLILVMNLGVLGEVSDLILGQFLLQMFQFGVGVGVLGVLFMLQMFLGQLLKVQRLVGLGLVKGVVEFFGVQFGRCDVVLWNSGMVMLLVCVLFVRCCMWWMFLGWIENSLFFSWQVMRLLLLLVIWWWVRMVLICVIYLLVVVWYLVVLVWVLVCWCRSQLGKLLVVSLVLMYGFMWVMMQRFFFLVILMVCLMLCMLLKLQWLGWDEWQFQLKQSDIVFRFEVFIFCSMLCQRFGEGRWKGWNFLVKIIF